MSTKVIFIFETENKKTRIWGYCSFFVYRIFAAEIKSFDLKNINMKNQNEKKNKHILENPEVCVFVPNAFIKRFEEIIEKFETSQHEFIKVSEEMQSS